MRLFVKVKVTYRLLNWAIWLTFISLFTSDRRAMNSLVVPKSVINYLLVTCRPYLNLKLGPDEIM